MSVAVYTTKFAVIFQNHTKIRRVKQKQVYENLNRLKISNQ